MRSADNTILVQFRKDWAWRVNAQGMIREYIANAFSRNWTSDGETPSPRQVDHARAVLGHLAALVAQESEAES